jgi:hypothetical protein
MSTKTIEHENDRARVLLALSPCGAAWFDLHLAMDGTCREPGARWQSLK